MGELFVKKTNGYLKPAFSLMEMMVVLLIVAILAAATAPMVTKKMARNAGSGDSPWVYTGLSNSIAFNMNRNDNSPVIIGASSLPASLESKTRLFIDSGDNASHIAFGNGNTTPIGITADPTKGRIGISNQYIPNDSIAFGAGQTLNKNSTGLIAIGANTVAGPDNSSSKTVNSAIAIGKLAQAIDPDSISIGYNAQAMNSTRYDGSMLYGGNIAIGTSAEAKDYRTIAIGYNAITSDSSTSESSDFAIAIGNEAKAKGNFSIAIGNGAVVKYGHEYSVAIGAGAASSASNQIVLGTETDTIYIPGNLIVGNLAAIGTRRVGDAALWTSFAGNSYGFLATDGQSSGSNVYMWNTTNATNYANKTVVISDRRLKNVGEAYTAGLDELKKLDFFHYTFKKDEAKTPHVGVMAQDLQKVFPDAVTEGDDGYLRIRMEDMFYAVINAVKELDTKICEIVGNVTSLSKKVDKQQQLIETQNRRIEELEARLTKLEKKKGVELH